MKAEILNTLYAYHDFLAAKERNARSSISRAHWKSKKRGLSHAIKLVEKITYTP